MINLMIVIIIIFINIKLSEANEIENDTATIVTVAGLIASCTLICWCYTMYLNLGKIAHDIH